jgi:DNA-binding transcriptional LysR family regulator
MVNLELYRVFYTVAKCGSLTKAAEELYISQPAVSQAIKQLETQLGGKLFNRTHKGMELSDAGGKQIFATVEKLTTELRFKLLYRLRHSRLRNIQFFGGAR